MATKEYKNKGPIFLTQAKYEAKQALGEIAAGQECRITDWEAQEKLIGSTGITIASDEKTISVDSTVVALQTNLPSYNGTQTSTTETLSNIIANGKTYTIEQHITATDYDI